MNLPLRRNTALSADLDEAQPGRVSRPATSKHTAPATRAAATFPSTPCRWS